jgi:hypothetical protein
VVRLVEDLQLGFALNQPLSAFALGAVDVLDAESPSYALDVVSVVEATLEDPRGILLAQQFLARGEAVAAMKADGIEYDERMELLEEVTWPQPLAELLTALFATYRQTHPWVSPDALSPKSVVRDMWERAMTFSEYVAFYGLSRSEGLVLRYLSDAYKALRQTVPESARTPALTELTDWLGAVVRQTDSSLLDEWEALLNTDGVEDRTPGDRPPARPLTVDSRPFRALVRSAMFRRVDLLSRSRWHELAALEEGGLSAEQWQQAGEAYASEHGAVGTGPDARGPALFVLTPPRDGHAVVVQILDDEDGEHDWRITADLDVAASEATGEPVLRTVSVAPTS